VFPRQPGLRLVISPSRVESVISPASLKFAAIPSRVENVISPASLKVAVSLTEVCVGCIPQ
jgi:hypothetical protein